ncbi:hypothetical protein P8C59_006891 [Phyllachora maydis]|uniref:Rhomboid family membrane protein n=1 Tax=Phyllachora maydis TaxID=1825666 RepID=A0AAD9MG12_9PEZI|nr:hypothetical protein P8C59_006891 [Phyllachora maydis]
MQASYSRTTPAVLAPSNPEDPKRPPWNGTHPMVHYGAIVCAVLGPVGIYLPSTRRGVSNMLQSTMLYGGTFWAFNQLAYDWTDKSISQRTNDRLKGFLEYCGIGAPEEKLPDKARQIKMLMDAERARRAQQLPAEERAAVTEATRRRTEQQEAGLLWRFWMGQEKEGWEKRRLEEERKALASGKSHADMIVDQIREVWSGKAKNEEVDSDVGGAPKNDTDGNDKTSR